MAKIIEEFVRSLPKLQARNIEKELQEPSSKLQLRTSQRFREAFQLKLRELLENDTSIRHTPIELLIGDKRSSELVDHMLDLISGDLSALFTEADLFLNLERLQELIYKDEVLLKLKRAVSEAETEIELLELLSGNTSGLKNAIVEKFRDGTNRLERESFSAPFAYIDPKLNLGILPQFDMPIDINVGGLVLPVPRRGL